MEKVPRVQTKDGIFVPLYAARLIKYFVENCRPMLRPRDEVLSVWINKRGGPLQGGAYNNRIKMVLFECFDQEMNVTPQNFRRLLPSLIFEYDIHPDGVCLRDFIVDYARYVGTSEKIMWTNYIRSKANDKNRTVNRTIHTLFGSPAHERKINATLAGLVGIPVSKLPEYVVTSEKKDEKIKELKQKLEMTEIKLEQSIANEKYTEIQLTQQLKRKIREVQQLEAQIEEMKKVRTGFFVSIPAIDQI